MFEYEHSSKFNVSETRGSLVKEIEGDDFHLSPIQSKIMLNDIEAILNRYSTKNLGDIESEFFKITGTEYENIINEMFKDLGEFIRTDPRIPDTEKTFMETPKLKITSDDSRENIIEIIKANREISETSRLALYVYRDMDIIDWEPFIKAALERNPVSFTDLKHKNNYEVYSILKELPGESIYEGNRLALPDEVWNFKRGDGIEKAFLLADFLQHKDRTSVIKIEIADDKVLLSCAGYDFNFSSFKYLKKSITIKGNDYRIST